jgi:hypothetical protein
MNFRLAYKPQTRLQTVNPCAAKKWSEKTVFAFKLEQENHGDNFSRCGRWSRFQRAKAASLVSSNRDFSVGFAAEFNFICQRLISAGKQDGETSEYILCMGIQKSDTTFQKFRELKLSQPYRIQIPTDGYVENEYNSPCKAHAIGRLNKIALPTIETV